MAEARPRAAIGGATRRRAGGDQREYQPTGTMTVTEAPPERPVLRLDLAPRRVRWSADTHDNEHDGGRTSKSCCIYHRPRRFDESSTESSADESDGSSGSDSSCDNSDGNDNDNGGDDAHGAGCGHGGGTRRARQRRRRHRRPRPTDGGGEDDGSSSSDGGQVRRPVRREVPPDDVNTFLAGGH